MRHIGLIVAAVLASVCHARAEEFTPSPEMLAKAKLDTCQAAVNDAGTHQISARAAAEAVFAQLQAERVNPWDEEKGE